MENGYLFPCPIKDGGVLVIAAEDVNNGLNRPLRVVVAGTAFGRIYLQALASTQEDFELVGIIAHGSEFSKQCAQQYAVPLYTRLDEVPDTVDIVCVVVRSGATGGNGAELAQAALRRGFHVLQEHPVHGAEITQCIKAARAGNTAYAVNTLYPGVRHFRQFLAVAEYLRSKQPIAYIEAACNSQMAYPLLDVIGRAVGSMRPWSFSEQVLQGDGSAGDRSPFQVLEGRIGGVPLSMRIQNQVHPDDPDNHSYLLQRLSLGCEAGVLTLVDTHGPLLWNPRLHSPRDETGRLIMAGVGTQRLEVPSMMQLGDASLRTYHEIFACTWPDGILFSLRELVRDIASPERRTRSAQWALSVTQCWRDMTAQIGMPELIYSKTPEAISLAEICHVAQQAMNETDRQSGFQSIQFKGGAA